MHVQGSARTVDDAVEAVHQNQGEAIISGEPGRELTRSENPRWNTTWVFTASESFVFCVPLSCRLECLVLVCSYLFRARRVNNKLQTAAGERERMPEPPSCLCFGFGAAGSTGALVPRGSDPHSAFGSESRHVCLRVACTRALQFENQLFAQK